MTDKEKIISICTKLNLDLVNTDPQFLDYTINDNEITMGCGRGFNGFNVSFFFDEEGNVINHEVYE